jgi:hypothetical protein
MFRSGKKKEYFVLYQEGIKPPFEDIFFGI